MSITTVDLQELLSNMSEAEHYQVNRLLATDEYEAIRSMRVLVEQREQAFRKKLKHIGRMALIRAVK